METSCSTVALYACYLKLELSVTIYSLFEARSSNNTSDVYQINQRRWVPCFRRSDDKLVAILPQHPLEGRLNNVFDI